MLNTAQIQRQSYIFKIRNINRKGMKYAIITNNYAQHRSYETTEPNISKRQRINHIKQQEPVIGRAAFTRGQGCWLVVPRVHWKSSCVRSL